MRLSRRSIGSLKAVIEDPSSRTRPVSSAVPRRFRGTQWRLDRVRFNVPWLRFTVLPGIDQQIVAGVAAAMILHTIPLLAALLAGP